MNYWIFKCNPKQYMIDARLEDPDASTTWQVTRYQGQIAPGDAAFIWKTGNERGICAVLSIDSYPIEMQELEHEMKYYKTPNFEKCLRVLATIKYRFPTISHQILKAHPELSNMSVFHGFQQATNFSVRPQEGKVILSLLSHYIDT